MYGKASLLPRRSSIAHPSSLVDRVPSPPTPSRSIRGTWKHSGPSPASVLRRKKNRRGTARALDVPTAPDPQSQALLLLDVLPNQTYIACAKLLLECGAHPDALSLLEGVFAAIDANVEGVLHGLDLVVISRKQKEGTSMLPSDWARTHESWNGRIWPVTHGVVWNMSDVAYFPRAPRRTVTRARQGAYWGLDTPGIQPSPMEEEEGNGEEWEVVSDDDEDEDIDIARLHHVIVKCPSIGPPT
ncbi:hypothetical protein OG21DRAFT_1484716 [Imleria badia]|nr:hypothetical protein OG21DRAFT_1484716 [Imleria badia]